MGHRAQSAQSWEMTAAKMFVIDGALTIKRIARRPRNWERLANFEGWRFIPEGRQWDADEVEAIAVASGVIDALGFLPATTSQAWLRRRAIEACERRPLNFTCDPD
jgi:hypothetical protein